jgi:hypothetical protein
LHRFDELLCAYLIDNITQHMDHPDFLADLEVVLTCRPLLDYLKEVQRDTDDAGRRLLLNAEELSRLEGTFDFTDQAWTPIEAFHRRYIDTLLEVRENLTRQVAEDWSEVCAKHAKELEDPDTRLWDGIRVLGDWLWELRRLLRAMDAISFLPCPEGRSPTPTCSTQILPSGSPPLRDPFATDMDAMRQAITQHDRDNPNIPDTRRGRSAPPDTLIKIAQIRPQRARNALRELQKLGEYSGFARSRPRRYQEGRRNEK